MTNSLYCLAVALATAAEGFKLAGAPGGVGQVNACEADVGDIIQSEEAAVSLLQGSLRTRRRQPDEREAQRKQVAFPLNHGAHQNLSGVAAATLATPSASPAIAGATSGHEKAAKTGLKLAAGIAKEQRARSAGALAAAAGGGAGGSAAAATAGAGSHEAAAAEEAAAATAATLATAAVAAVRVLKDAEAEAGALRGHTSSLLQSLAALASAANATAAAGHAQAATSMLDNISLDWMAANSALEGAVALLTGALSRTGHSNLSKMINVSLVGTLAPLVAFSAQLVETRQSLASVSHNATPSGMESALRKANLSLQVGLSRLVPAREGLARGLRGLEGAGAEQVALAALAGLRAAAPPLASELLREAGRLAAGAEDALHRLPSPPPAVNEDLTLLAVQSEVKAQRSAAAGRQPAQLVGLWAATLVSIAGAHGAASLA